MRGRKPQPFAADVMDVREDCGDRTSPAPGRFGAPRSRIQMLEHDLVHPVIYGVTLHQRLTKIEENGSLRARHGICLMLNDEITASTSPADAASAPGLPESP